MPHALETLLKIDEPHLVARYERALEAFDLKSPGLDQFDIDMTGWSPQVAEALDDKDYLDLHQVNRKFIILSPDQAHLPVVHSSFSNTQDLMQEFFDKNRRVLFALTIKDVVFGEIEDSVFKVDDIDDLLAIEQVTFKIGTHENLTEKTNKLKRMIDRLRKEPDAWRDDAMLHEMVDIAKQTGDIRDNELVPDEVVFRHKNFWSSHFGGTYVFNDEKQITVICDRSAPGFRKSRPWEVGYLDINNAPAVFKFLVDTGRIEKPSADWIKKSKLLQYRKFMAAAYLAQENGDALPANLSDTFWMQTWVSNNRTLVRNNNALPLIDWALEQSGFGLEIKMQDIDPQDYFLLSRAVPQHSDMALVNRLIAHYLPFDFISRYEFYRPGFVKDREQWSEKYSEFVVKTMSDTYLNNRTKLFENLYL